MTRAVVVLFSCILGTQLPTHAQSASQSIRSILQSSLNTMVGAKTIDDITLSGNVEFIAGSTDETGAFTFRGTTTGFSRVDVALPSGTRSDTRQPGNGTPLGAWTFGDGVVHASVQHNLMSGYWWASPVLIVNQILTDPSMVVAFDGEEGSLAHFTAHEQTVGASAGANATLGHLTEFDIWLDASSLLPARLSFSIHPDSNAGLDIPVQVQFSGYQTVGGVVTPTHVQRLINDTLVLDVQIQSASMNTGLTSAVFSLQ
jgi:hypothetical protein